MQKLKAVVVGVGYLGKEHARIYSELSDVELVALVDLDWEKVSKWGHRYHAQPLQSLEGLPSGIDLASVAVPTVDHFKVAEFLLDRGIHVLVEKPIAQRVEQAAALIQKAQQKGLILQVGHIERYNPAFQALQKILTSPRFIECHRLSPFPERGTDVGVVLDLMIHDIDVILQLTPSPLREIRAVGVPVLSAFEDIANARLEFENGCIANLTTSRVSVERMRKVRVFQEDAYISLDYLRQEGKIYHKENGKISWKNIKFEKAEPLKLEIASFMDCVRHAKNPLVSGEHGKMALEVAMEVLKEIKNEKLRMKN
ncbi:MAG: Gfo/Idh/MocA family oxidoreductase [Chlamydiae bacterium]|nr:Gfo/Idh/MocA family oxidoreductase [Chlamydiota bacterium]MBI3266174.1 Gfo/Idh/MocA family oxidoreductase [Chlamydiota bacterium]